jgi:hypothetical protein
LTRPPGARNARLREGGSGHRRHRGSHLACAALADLRTDLVPGAPGFTSAYWLESVDGAGMPVIVFETRGPAGQAAACPLPPLPGVTPLALETRDVHASA